MCVLFSASRLCALLELCTAGAIAPSAGALSDALSAFEDAWLADNLAHSLTSCAPDDAERCLKSSVQHSVRHASLLPAAMCP